MVFLRRCCIAALLLFGISFYLCHELFVREFIDQPGSIEPAYIALARYVRDNWRDLTWLPLWYGGIPYQNSYPPLLHWISGFTAVWLPPGQAYHAVCASFYCLGAASFYWLAWRLSRSQVAAWVAGLLYATVSPSALLIPSIHTDLGGMYAGRRLQALTGWGEGPHVAALALLPVAIMLFDGPWWAAALAMAAVALTNWLGTFSLAVACLCWWLAAGDRRASVRKLAAAGMFAYAIAAPWIPPSTIAAVSRNAPEIGGDFRNVVASMPLRMTLVVIVLAASAWLLRRLTSSEGLRFAVLFTVAMSALTLSAEWFHRPLLPQAERYHLQMEMGLCLLAGFAVAAVPGRGAVAAAAVLTVASIWPVMQVRRATRDVHIRPLELRQTVLYRLPAWLQEQRFQDRVFLHGALSWYLNIFADTPQFDGGFAQGLVNHTARLGWYSIVGDPDPVNCILWLKAFGIHAVSTGGPDSGEHYKPYKHPRKFDGLLEPLWREGSDVLYRVPHRTRSLARVVSRYDLVTGEPKTAQDLTAYVAALENPSLPLASFEWRSRHSAVIRGSLASDHVLSVQVTHHPGWRGEVAGRAVPLRADGLGQIVVEPACEGECQIELIYDGGREMLVCRLLLPAVLLVFTARRRALRRA